ncbi:F-box protein At1g30790-like [Coffea eugenioides]|uniref:F-box protein At1g30790-like n=1 Tax=Coffea eugenioides TaxID=49369 RepID=UPI000F604D7E|nr:F-box protein At1g30790-like [Coffea eugenioides]
MSDYIPDHLLAHVLLRLPFHSLLRSTCVSKSWRALIDSSGFIKMHLSKANQEANSPNGIKIIALNQDKLYTSDLDLEAHSSSTSVLLQMPNSSAALLIITVDTALGDRRIWSGKILDKVNFSYNTFRTELSNLNTFSSVEEQEQIGFADSWRKACYS